ncbi:MAG: RAMP superfamily CRISPR-associated protein [Brevinematia bacterium]
MNIKVKLLLKTFRVGGREGTERSDLPVFFAKLLDGSFLILPASTFKGILRRSAERAIMSLKLNEETAVKLIDAYNCLFGTANYFSLEYSHETRKVFLKPDKRVVTFPSILRFRIEPIKVNELKIKRRVSIRVNNKLLSVEKNALWDYEFISVSFIDVNLIFTREINKYEKLLLYFALNNLKYESIGGLGSRGIGLIENVKIMNEDFEKEAKMIAQEVKLT